MSKEFLSAGKNILPKQLHKTKQDTEAPVNVAQYTDEPNMTINMQLPHSSTQTKRMND